LAPPGTKPPPAHRARALFQAARGLTNARPLLAMTDVERALADETAPLRPSPASGARADGSSDRRAPGSPIRFLVGVSILALVGTFGAFVHGYGGDLSQVLHLSSVRATPVAFIHVPRTGGDSLKYTVKNLGVPILAEERCYKYMHKEHGVVNAVLFRDPKQHVLSQYSHCFANPHGAASMSPLWGLPRGQRGDTPKNGWSHGLNKWLAHFNNWRRGDGYFNCFNPLNMQARYLTCGTRDEALDKALNSGAERWGTPEKPGRAVWFQSAHYLGANDEPEPSVEKLLRRLDSMQVVGVTEALKESACLTEYHARGAMHPACECGAEEGKFPLAEEMHEVYQPKVFAELPEEDRKMVLNVTRVDRLLHRYAVQRFIHDAKLVEKASGKRFLCGETRKKLDGFLREHAEGELEANLGVKWTEFKPNAKSKQHHAEASMGAMMPMGERKKLKAYSDVESDALMRKMERARAASVLPPEALSEVPMTHFEFS